MPKGMQRGNREVKKPKKDKAKKEPAGYKAEQGVMGGGIKAALEAKKKQK